MMIVLSEENFNLQNIEKQEAAREIKILLNGSLLNGCTLPEIHILTLRGFIKSIEPS